MKHVFKIGTLMFAMAVLAVAIVTGCASAPLRTETSTSGIHAAEELGAADVPQASLHLQFAKEELALAKKMNSNGDEERAKSMLMRAEADAELAVALSHGNDERLEAEEAMDRVQQLRYDKQ